MKSKALLLLTIPFLLACSNKKSSYNGPKINVARNESGSLVTTTPEEMYSLVVDDKADAVFYIGDDLCAACATLKPQLIDWVKVYKGTIYYISLNEITESNINYVSSATEGYYQWTEKSTVPAVYFFMQGEVIFCADQTNAMDYLLTYVEVSA